MTNNELNQFILHYLVEDKTHSAIMLTGAWGTGKSYYIQNELVPFLKEEHEKECVTVSLYGIKSTAEISRSIYIELRAKTLSAKGEAAVAGKLIAKTIVRGVVSRFGIDFSKENDTMQELYESINLSNKLVILEDIERSQIEVIELLGYVNSLVEQDNVKVLYVIQNEEKYILREQFAKSLDVERLAEMFFKSNPQQKDCIRGAFITVYRLGNIGQYLSDDATVIEELCQLIEKDAPKQTGDRVQALQYRFFIDNLKQILEKLQ